MQIKQFLLSTLMVAGIAVVSAVLPTQASADGGMMVLSTTTDAPVTISSELSAQQRITYLETLVKLYAAVQSLTNPVPEVKADDEGSLTVVINDAMRFPCDGKGGQTGEWCVRHVGGGLGESYIDLNEIIGFPYDERFAFTVTLFRSRAATYVAAGATPDYDYYLMSINDIEYQR